LRFEVNPDKKLARPYLNRKKLGMVACTCHPSYGRKLKIGGSRSRLARAKVRPPSQNKQNKKGWSMAQAIEHLPSEIKARSSNPNTAKKKNDRGNMGKGPPDIIGTSCF
jgi:hypothetical protein